MISIKPILFTFFCMGLLIASEFCANAQLPEKWSAKMQLNIFHGGGMVPESFTVKINSGDCKYIHWQPAKTDTLEFICKQEELDYLLYQLNNKDFDHMSSGETTGIVYDRPTTYIEFRWGEKNYKVSIGAAEEIKKGSAVSFNELWGDIMRLAMKKTGQGPAR